MIQCCLRVAMGDRLPRNIGLLQQAGAQVCTIGTWLGRQSPAGNQSASDYEPFRKHTFLSARFQAH